MAGGSDGGAAGTPGLPANLLDREGRVTRWPRRKAEKIAVLRYVRGKFEPGRKYSEREVNATIMRWLAFEDYALVRRELYDNFLLGRKPDGSEYWAEDGSPA